MSDIPLSMDAAGSTGMSGWKLLVLSTATTVSIGVLIGLPWLFESCYLLGLIGYSWLMIRASRETSYRATGDAFAAGFIALWIAFHWAANSIEDTTNLGRSLSVVVFFGLILWEAIAFAWLGLVCSLLGLRGPRYLWFVVPVWVTIEFYWPKIFNWATAHAYLGFPPILQLAEFAGTSGVTACAVLGSVALVRVWLHPKDKSALVESAVALGMIAFACGWGALQQSYWKQQVLRAPSIRVAAIQVNPTFVESLDQMQAFSDQVDGEVDLILWPESTLGNYHVDLDHFGDETYTYDHAEMPNPAIDPYPRIHCDLLAGGKTYDDGGRHKGPYKNTAFLIDKENRIRGRYVKRSLMPIGEYVPGESVLPVLRDWAAVDVELVRGTSDAPLQLSSGHRVAMLVCYEDMVAANASTSVLEGAECLIALANGSAFKDPDTLLQHLKLAQLRTIENRRALIRCAATGVTCLIGPDGKIEKRLPVSENGLLVANVPLFSELTFYTKFGDWLPRIATFISFFALVGLALPSRKRDPRKTDPRKVDSRKMDLERTES